MPTILTDLNEYLQYKESTLREDSFEVYRLFGKKFKQYLLLNKFDGVQTRKFPPKQCEGYRRYILKLHRHPTTRNKEIAQMKTFFY